MTFCYFGIYNPDFGRNKIYIKALKKAGHTVIECRDDSHGILKYWRLWKKHREIQNSGKGIAVYDAMIVGYPGHIVTPFAKVLSKKIVIVDALGSLYDAEINSHKPGFMRKIKSRLADWLAVTFADKILLESGEQRNYFEKKFGKSDKYEVVYTGVDEEVFSRGGTEVVSRQSEISLSSKISTGAVSENSAQKFTVLFRGKLTPESGILYVLQAAEILKGNSDIVFKILGYGYFLEKVKKEIAEKNLTSVELISEFLPEDRLIKEMSNANIMLGQFENNSRLNRTIPHKAFEAFSMGIPYITGDAPAIREIVEDNISAFLVPLADSQALAERIEYLSSQPELLSSVAQNAKNLYNNKFSFAKVAEHIARISV